MSGGYWQYPIRCQTCLRPLAAYETRYKKLLKKMTKGEALNTLGLMQECCRVRMLEPSFIPYNEYDRDAVEGNITNLRMIDKDRIYIPDHIIKREEILKSMEDEEGEEIVDEREKLFPSQLGIPVHNPNPAYPPDEIYIGDREIRANVLLGNTYLAV